LEATKSGVLKVVSWNIGRGLLSKLPEINNLIASEKIDIITLSEVDLPISEDAIFIEGFRTVLPMRRKPEDKVRIMSLVRESVFSSTSVRKDLMSPDLPSVWLEYRGFLFCSLYREWSPQGDRSSGSQMGQVEVLIDQINTAVASGKNLVVMGDINLDKQRWDEHTYSSFNLSEELRTCLATCGLEIHDLGLTYKSHQCVDGNLASSALDHIYSNSKRPIKTRSLDIGMSDHLPIMAEVEVGAKKFSESLTYVRKRCFKNLTPAAFRLNLLFHGNVEAIISCYEVDQQVELLDEMVTQVLDKLAPYKMIRQRSSFRNGLTQETKLLMKKRDSICKEVASLTGEAKLAKHNDYKAARNRCLHLQKKDTIKFNMDKFNNLSHPNDAWKAAKQLTNPKTPQVLQLRVGDTIVEEELMVANTLNDFFVEKVKKLRDDIIEPRESQPVNKSPRLEASKLELRTVTEGEVQKAIKGLKSKPSSGLDQVNSMILKDGGEVLSMLLTHIVNTSITTGKFPARWKKSKVIPLFKKGDNKDCGNYRPISNLSVVSKVLEILILKQVTKYCDDLNIIPDSQHGFQSGKSTMTALISMVDGWLEALDRGESVGVLLFDLTAAFDTLDPAILLEKLKSRNFSSRTVNWISSYMAGREQQVQVGSKLSDKRSVEVGVPQGSVLGPLLFLLYISDIHNWVGPVNVVGFADDTSVSFSSKNISNLVETLELEASRVLDYMSRNKLVANAKKTGFLLIRGKGCKKWPITSVNVGSDPVVESQCLKILGVQVSNNLKWSDHLRYVVNGLRYRIFTMRRLTYKLPRKYLQGLLDGIVYSQVRYCLPLFSRLRFSDEDPKNCYMEAVQKQLNAALRVVLGVKISDKVSIYDLHSMTNMLTFNQIAIQATQKLTWNIMSDKSKGLKGFYGSLEKPHQEDERKLRSSHQGRLEIPSRNNINTNSSFKEKSRDLWNELKVGDRWAKKLPKKVIKSFP
jgi:hypothetical protein